MERGGGGCVPDGDPPPPPRHGATTITSEAKPLPLPPLACADSSGFPPDLKGEVNTYRALVCPWEGPLPGEDRYDCAILRNNLPFDLNFPTKAIRVQFPGGSLRFFAYRNRAGRCHWLVGFLWVLPFPLPFYSDAASYSPQSPSSALKTLMLRVVLISSLCSLEFALP
ncbi:hypothetical protein PR048_014434 [Dryococelus australis]|uniref:Uncharacterized protein n=1 Tax=Dryococelus australis TaxID=614101 RepID=A0ABQ9HEG3_9NEOP|nr:hypothetical protein PR048_014434 [Dryococelus australis]